MRPTDFVTAATMHATARFTVRYGEELRFAGADLPRPRKHRVTTRHGRVPAYVYLPPSRDRLGGPTYVHAHGGAWLMRRPQMGDFWCRYLVATAGVTVVNVDYTAGPYAVYPVAQEQCHDVALWAAEQGGQVAVGGFSSGGGMAASVCLQARDTGSFTPVLQVLGVPALDLATEVSRDQLGEQTAQISPALRDLVRRVYFPDRASRLESYASPVLADDLTGLPPAVVLTAEHDSLRDDGLRYVERLRQADVEVRHDDTPGADHYFLSADLTRARRTMALVAAEVARRTGATPPG